MMKRCPTLGYSIRDGSRVENMDIAHFRKRIEIGEVPICL